MPCNSCSGNKSRLRSESYKEWNKKFLDRTQEEKEAFIAGYNMGWKSRHRLEENVEYVLEREVG